MINKCLNFIDQGLVWRIDELKAEMKTELVSYFTVWIFYGWVEWMNKAHS